MRVGRYWRVYKCSCDCHPNYDGSQFVRAEVEGDCRAAGLYLVKYDGRQTSLGQD
jgi:hypothetical protein